MKKLFALLLTLGLVSSMSLGVVGCKTETPPKKTETTKKEETKKDGETTKKEETKKTEEKKS